MRVSSIDSDLEVFKCITFIENIHKYYINDEPSADKSVTGLINIFKPKFDEDKWSSIKAKSLGISQDEMKFIWKESNVFSTTLGTYFHNIAESHYTKKPLTLNKKSTINTIGEEAYKNLKVLLGTLVRQFDKFYKQTRDTLEPVRNELVIGDINDSRVCGTMDLLCYNKVTERYEIYDFKTNKNIGIRSEYKQMFLTPLDHIPLCEFNTYSLQLSIYKYILEKYTSINVGAMYVVWFRRDSDSYETIEVTDYTAYVPGILSSVKDKKYTY